MGPRGFRGWGPGKTREKPGKTDPKTPGKTPGNPGKPREFPWEIPRTGAPERRRVATRGVIRAALTARVKAPAGPAPRPRKAKRDPAGPGIFTGNTPGSFRRDPGVPFKKGPRGPL